MSKTRVRGTRAPKNNKVKRPVSCGFMKRKKRGHEHVMFLLKNTKRQDVHRCRICKHHFISVLIFQDMGIVSGHTVEINCKNKFEILAKVGIAA